jgi:hypothetical protein
VKTFAHTTYLQVKHYIHGHPVLFPWIQKIRGADYGTFCGTETDLCIEGFQSSANSFVYNGFRILQPDLDIAHHTHSIANVRRAFSFEIPVLILFRDPVDVIPSMSSRFHPSLKASVNRYIHFYRFVLRNSSKVILASFEEVTTDFATTIRRVEQQTEMDFETFDVDEVRRQTVQHIRNWSKIRGKEDQMSLPRQERESRKAELRARLPSVPRFEEAQTVYRRLNELSGKTE